MSIFLTQFFCIKPYVPREPQRNQSNYRLYEHGIWYISDTARYRTRNLFHPKCALIPLGHSDGRTLIKSSSSSPGSSPEWVPIFHNARSLHRAYHLSLHPSEVVHRYQSSWNIKAVTMACLLIDGCSCVWPHVQWHHLAYATEMKLIQLHDSIVMALPWDYIVYITLD